jgi:hypothetical protein
MVRQNQEIDTQHDNILHTANQKEEEEKEYQQPSNDMINIEENTNITGYKLNTNWYVSLLMYNSY